MVATIQALFSPAQIGTTAKLLFTASRATRVGSLTVTNTNSVSTYAVTIYWVPAGQMGASVMTQVVSARKISPSESWEATPMVDHVLAPGDTIWASCDAGSLNIFGSGVVS